MKRTILIAIVAAFLSSAAFGETVNGTITAVDYKNRQITVDRDRVYSFNPSQIQCFAAGHAVSTAHIQPKRKVRIEVEMSPSGVEIINVLVFLNPEKIFET